MGKTNLLRGTNRADLIFGTNWEYMIFCQDGNDMLFAGLGDDIAIYAAGENFGAWDEYEGAQGYDTLRITLTYPEWLLLNAGPAQLQTDFTNYLAFQDDQTNGGRDWAGPEEFTFQAIGLQAASFEHLQVLVDGVEINPADEPVTAEDDFYLGLDGVIEVGPRFPQCAGQ